MFEPGSSWKSGVYIALPDCRGCSGLSPHWVQSRTPDQGVTGAGGFQRKSPVGLAANGMSRHVATALLASVKPPTIWPASMVTRVAASATTGRVVSRAGALSLVPGLVVGAVPQPNVPTMMAAMTHISVRLFIGDPFLVELDDAIANADTMRWFFILDSCSAWSPTRPLVL